MRQVRGLSTVVVGRGDLSSLLVAAEREPRRRRRPRCSCSTERPTTRSTPASPPSRRSAPPTTSRSTRPRTRPTSPRPTSTSTARSSSSATPATRSTPRRSPPSRRYIQGGGGFVGIGGAAEAEPGSTFFNGLIGARPAAGSPTATAEKVVAVGDRVHPANEDLPLEWTRSDVWYEWTTRPTGQVHTVARYRAPNAPAGDGTATGGTDWPISWCRDFQGGRSFYTGMGRTAAAFGEANLRTHLLGAIQWSAGMIRGGCKATIAANYSGTRLVDGSNPGLAHTGESHGVAPAPNGWVFYIGRADCRTNEQRGQMIGLRLEPAHPRLREPQRRHRLRQRPHLGSRRRANGTVNSGVTLAGDPARLRRPRRRSRDQRQDRGRPARHHGGARLHADRAHLPPVLPDLQPGQPGAPGPRRRRPAADHEDEQGAGLAASRSTSRPSSSSSTPRS